MFNKTVPVIPQTVVAPQHKTATAQPARIVAAIRQNLI